MDQHYKFFELNVPNFFETPEGIYLNQLRPRPDHRYRLFSVIHATYSSKIHNTGQTAYLRTVHGETVTITHPCHPLNGRSVEVLHFRSRSQHPHVLIELPNGCSQAIPISWTDRAVPNIHNQCKLEGLRLSPFALLEVAEWLQNQKPQI